MNSATLNLLITDKLKGENYTSWKNMINTILIIDDLHFVLMEDCPPIPAPNATQNVQEAYELWTRTNEKARVYILASLSEVLAKKHEPHAHISEIMESLRRMFELPSAQLRHVILKHISNVTFQSLMKLKGQKDEANVASSSKKFHRGSTSGTNSILSSSGTKKWKKKKGGTLEEELYPILGGKEEGQARKLVLGSNLMMTMRVGT
ncbi:uncharacterized protein LOC120078009 [Benincasa hispida]|uniref:uncharacterized protein LOC120078009 n=1 Tax=Benincasa hispida TaxID=102211 RepID=UPI0019004053|nr:uncharacterized protein LOC120078009 [Benincasa hispida]